MSATLNPGQREAVDARSGRVVVSAGAGSGKTRVLVHRFVDHVLEREAAGDEHPVRSVLLITFTDKAAGELTERVRSALLEADRPDLAREVDGAWISTIHSLCARIVRRHALELGIDVGFGVLVDPRGGVERSEAFERAVRRCLEDAEIGGEIADLVQEGVPALRDTILGCYDRARSRGVLPADIAAPQAKPVGDALHQLLIALAEVMPEYEALAETKTVAANKAGYRRLREQAEFVSRMPDGRAAAEALVALAGYRGGSAGGERMKELTGQINGALADAVQAGVDTRAAQRAQAWTRLLTAFAEEYDAAKDALGVLDFEDLQLLTRRLWTEHPEIAERVGDRFAEVMVDEFQDINPLQKQVIDPISRGGQCVVGDVQQSIYRFRDADVGLLEEKRRHAEAAEDERACRLTVNYRSNARLLRGLNAIFGTDDFFGDDYLRLDPGSDEEEARWPTGRPRIEGLIVDKSLCPDKDWREVEARALAERLAALVRDGIAEPEEIVVLLRASTTMPVYVHALRAAGLDVIAPSSGGFYQTPEYADVRALLRVMANPRDDEGVLALLAGGLGGLSDDALLFLSRPRAERGMWGALGERSDVLTERDAARGRILLDAVEALHAGRTRIRLADAILHAASVLGPEGGLTERPEAWSNIRKIARMAAEFEGAGAGDPAELLAYFEDRETFVPREPSAGLMLEGSHAVRVMTVHAAKGLEFPVVAVADLGHETPNRRPNFLLAPHGTGLMAANRGPAVAKGDKTPKATAWQAAVDAERIADLAEAKRVFYVACTRAERALILAGSLKDPAAGAPDIAADWVLSAARSGGPELAGLMSVTVLGADDVPPEPEAAPVRGSVAAGEPTPAHRVIALPTSAPIPPPREVSYTALALYDRCAYRFFAERLLRVGSLESSSAQDPKAFGSALHAVLELVARGETVDEERLARVAVAHGLPTETLERLRAARRAVHDSGVEPLITRGRPEVPFSIAVEGGVVRGTMDLVVVEGDRATVLDYKSGTTWDETGARYKAQAETYALALLVAGMAEVDVRFVHVEAGCEEAVYRVTATDRERIRTGIEATLARIATGEFPPLTAYDYFLCADCPVSGGMCHVVHPHTRDKRGA